MCGHRLQLHSVFFLNVESLAIKPDQHRVSLGSQVSSSSAGYYHNLELSQLIVVNGNTNEPGIVDFTNKVSPLALKITI